MGDLGKKRNRMGGKRKEFPVWASIGIEPVLMPLRRTDQEEVLKMPLQNRPGGMGGNPQEFSKNHRKKWGGGGRVGGLPFLNHRGTTCGQKVSVKGVCQGGKVSPGIDHVVPSGCSYGFQRKSGGGGL